MAVPQAEVDRRMQLFTDTCRQNGMKVTHQRMEVFRELAATDEHPDAETLYQRVSARVPTISRDTVYRTLTTLERFGLVRKAEIMSNRGRYDANTLRHHHFVCTRCEKVLDFYSEAFDDLPIPDSARELGTIQSTHVQIRGICSDCAADERSDF